VIGLLFIGCPTESEGSSGEVLDYTKTELWAAVIKAETLLNQTEVTTVIVSPSTVPDGQDIPTGVLYVTGVQKTAFSQAIGKAKALAQAGISGVDETEAIEDLAGARTIFETAKAANKASNLVADDPPGGSATPVKPSVVPATLTDDVTVIIESGTLPAAVDVAGNILIVPAGIVVTKGASFDPNAGDLLVKAGGTFIVPIDGTRDAGTNDGTITIESGAIYYRPERGAGLCF
jgi:hypothetical protein